MNTAFSHILEASKNTHNPKILENLRQANWLIGEFSKYNQILFQWKNWLIATKLWPSSENDCMLIYSGKNENISSLAQLSNEEKKEFAECTEKMVNFFKNQFHSEIQSWNFALISGINHSFFPWPGKAQSVFRPHVHFTLVPLFHYQTPAICTKKICENIETIFSLNEKNKEIIAHIFSFLQSKNINCKMWKVANMDDMCIDIPLKENIGNHMIETSLLLRNFLEKNYFSPMVKDLFENNARTLEEIEKIWDKNNLENSKKNLQKYENNADLLQNFQELWFSLSIVFDSKNEPTLRIFGTYKTPGGGIWHMESRGHSLVRNRVDTPNLVNQEYFRQKIKKFFNI